MNKRVMTQKWKIHGSLLDSFKLLTVWAIYPQEPFRPLRTSVSASVFGMRQNATGRREAAEL